MAAAELLHKGITALWILPSRLAGTSHALLEPLQPQETVLGGTAFPCNFGADGTVRDEDVTEPLSRTAAQELQLAAILTPLATTELRSQESPVIAAPDASPSASVTVETQVSGSLASVLWRHSERKGAFSRVLREKGLLSASDEIAALSDTGPGTVTRRGPDASVCDVKK